MPALHCSLDLPPGFRVADILKFHRRDTQAYAEKVLGDTIVKGLVWRGMPASLTVAFGEGRAEARLDLDGALDAGDAACLPGQVGHMLGLRQAVEDFEQRHAGHPVLGVLLQRQSGLRVPVAATPFEALTWAIAGQQISVGAALSLRRKLIQAAGMVHSSGLACYPDAARLVALDEAALHAAGFSQSKARTLCEVGRLVVAGDLPLDDWRDDPPVDTLRERLLAVRGIGPWTVNYTLLRGFGWLDGSLHGDVAVRRALQQLTGAPAKIGEAAAQQWLEPFSPWRALVAAHLWASLTSPQPTE